MKNMNTRNIAYWGGGAISTIIIVVNLLNGIRFELGEPFFSSFLPMLIQSLLIAVVFYLPAQVLKDREFAHPIALLYPILTGLSLIFILINGNSLRAQTIAGVVIMVTMIFCVVYALGSWLRGRRVSRVEEV